MLFDLFIECSGYAGSFLDRFVGLVSFCDALTLVDRSPFVESGFCGIRDTNWQFEMLCRLKEKQYFCCD